MRIRHFNQSRNILSVILLTVIFVLSWYAVNLRTSPAVAESKMVMVPGSADDVIAKLKVSVRQVSGSGSGGGPAKLALAVTNAHDGAVTILSWNTPLDPLALQLGVVSFFAAPASIPADSENDDGGGGGGGGDGGNKIGEKIEIPTIQIRRRMPPGPESLVTIGAGQTSEQEVEVRGPGPLETLRGRRVAVVCAGEWTGVWLSEADAVAKVSSLHAGASEGALRGSFQSEPVEMVL
ncbi:hypothetical protein F5B19DRAFT_45780 [Rostrohypoxylon terebratum]|nr:hypothetical protein F5B19DRAFT_45780 [Rostrohypoxylon terebratum]